MPDTPNKSKNIVESNVRLAQLIRTLVPVKDTTTDI